MVKNESFQRQKGVSLIEVMMSVFIMSTFMLGVMTLQLNKAKIAQVQQQYYGAWLLMEYKLSELRLLANSDDAFNQIESNVGGMQASGDVAYSQYNYSLSWQVTNAMTDDDMLHIKTINVVVAWQNQFDDINQISEETIVAVHYKAGARSLF